MFKKDKEDKNMNQEKGKKTFNQWSKKFKVQYQKVGEVENKDFISKAKDMFRGRKRRNSSVGGGSTGGNPNELKRPDQLLKVSH